MTIAIASGTRDALSKGSFYNFDPDQLILVTDKEHPLFDPRALEKPDEALVESMFMFGFKTSSSIEVESTNEGMVVVDGRRRTIAARECKRRQIEAGEDVTIRVRCIISKDKPFVGMILGNSHRKNETILQRAAKAQRAISNGYSENEVAALFGVTSMTIRNWLAAAQLPASIRKAVDEEKITITLALELAKKTPEEQEQVLSSSTPIRGSEGKARVKKPTTDEVSKRLNTKQIRDFYEAIREDKRDGVNMELTMAVLAFIVGDDPTGKQMIPFEPIREIAKSVLKD